jgi:hypothetical protein
MNGLLANANGWLKFLPLIGFMALSAKLFVSGLWRTYKWFAAYLAFETLRIVLALSIRNGSNLYALFYFVCEPLTWLLSMLAVLEVYGMVLKSHPGIEKWGRIGIFVAMVLSLVISAAMPPAAMAHPEIKYRLLHSFVLLSRFVTVSLLFFLLAATAILAWFPLVLKRNTVLHCCLFAVFFLSKAGYFVALTLFGMNARLPIDSVLMIAVAFCTGAWLVWLNRKGEEVPVTTGPNWDRDHERRVLAQLDSINAALLNSAKD